MFKLDHIVSNDSASARLLVLEPWGAEYSLGPAERLTVILESSESGFLEQERSDHAIVLYAWPGSSAKVQRGGHLLGEHDRVPEIPRNMTMPAFLKLLLGQE